MAVWPVELTHVRYLTQTFGAAVTKFLRLVGANSVIVFLTGLNKGWKVWHTRVPIWLGSDESPLPGVQMVCSFPVSSQGGGWRDAHTCTHTQIFFYKIKALIPSCRSHPHDQFWHLLSPKEHISKYITGGGDSTHEFWRNTNVQAVAIFSFNQLRLLCLSVQALLHSQLSCCRMAFQHQLRELELGFMGIYCVICMSLIL